MSKQAKNRLVTIPSIGQIQSGEVKNPTAITVKTLMMAFRGGLGFLSLTTYWKIDYPDKELQYVGGILRMPLILEPILPFQVPESHIRAARKITAAVFGRKRFRGRVRMYEKYGKDFLYRASHEGKTIFLTNREDALLWGLENDYSNPKVQQLSLDEVKMLYPKHSLQELIIMAQKNSLSLKAEPMRLRLQKIVSMKADEKLDKIKKTGYNLLQIGQFMGQLFDKMKS